MEKYKLKIEALLTLSESAQKGVGKEVQELKWWGKNTYFNEDALEKLEADIKMRLLVQPPDMSLGVYSFTKGDDKTKLSDKEIEGVEWFLNKFGDKETILDKIMEYGTYRKLKSGEVKTSGIFSFVEWLKER